MTKHWIGMLLVATGCGLLEPTAPEIIESLARPALGGSAYAQFRLLPNLPAARDERAAVKLTYLMTDDRTHQSEWSQKITSMMEAWPQRRVHNVIFRDGEELGDTRISYLTGPGRAESLPAPGASELQSNNPKLFSQVLAWTLDRYPGKRKYLELYTHGLGAMGLGTDETQTDPQGESLPDADRLGTMHLADFAEALRQGLKGRTLDLIYFRACLMGNLEALAELHGTTRYAVASEDISLSTDNSNLTMTEQFETLAAQGAEPEAIAKALTIQGHANRARLANGAESGYQTLAAVDMARVEDLKRQVDGLAKALLKALPRHQNAILSAYDSVRTIHGNQIALSDSDHLRDLWAFTAQLLRQVPDPAVQQAALAVREAQRRALFHTRDAYGEHANGLSIFLPARAQRGQLWPFLQNSYARTRLARETNWDEFLWAMFQAE